MTDRPGRLLPQPPLAPPAAGADLLSDVLKTVRLRGAVFFMLDMSAPWAGAMPDGTALAPLIVPSAEQVISYHVIVRGTCWGGLLGGTPSALHAGDVIVFPHGDGYYLSTNNQSSIEPNLEDAFGFMRGQLAGQIPFLVQGGGGGPERLEVVCGFLGCDLRPFNPLLGTLPRLLHVKHPAAETGDRLDRLLELTLDESRAPSPGSESVRLRLSELMFVEVIRRHLSGMSTEQTGWLAGLADPFVGRALGLLHQRAAHDWTLDELGLAVGLSRSAFAERFARLVGEPPMQYLTRWRMQLAASLLAEDSAKVATVALTVGYDSEAAFSRAFKKATGTSPALWRRERART